MVFAETVRTQIEAAEAARLAEANAPREGDYILEKELTFTRPR